MKGISEIWENKFFQSDVHSATKLKELQEAKITHIIQVLPDCFKPPHEDKFEYLVLHADDNASQNLKQYFEQAVEFTKKALENPSSKILVHCAAGRSRSGGISCALLMAIAGLSLEEALTLGMTKRPGCFYPNEGFMLQLREFEEELRK